jgi:hypothetical protein
MGSMLDVPGVQFLGDQDLHRLAQKLVPRVSEHILRDPVQKDDPAIGVDLHNRVRRGFEQFAKSFF